MQILQGCIYGNEDLGYGSRLLRTKKGRSFAERPKSREETPKVGNGEW